MREILFRGKRVDNGEWVQGFYALVASNKGLKHVIYTVAENGCVIPYEVDRETVGEYINRKGMDDKKIFEGDIILAYRTMFPRNKYKFVITPDYCKWRSDYPFAFLTGDEYNLKIIGNIHDNPELIKKRK